MLTIGQRKWVLPASLPGLDENVFRKWLRRKAAAHVRRDRKRGFKLASVSGYMAAIIRAIEASGGRDYYTGEPLDWVRIGLWRNAEAAERRGEYRREFWNLPSVDHDFTDPANPVFHICSWRVNDSKNDQSLAEFLALADAVRRHVAVSRR